MSNEKKYYRKLAALNNGTVAVTYKTRKGKDAPEKEAAFLVTTPRGFAVKMNELKMVSISFKKNFETGSETYFNYRPVDEKFTHTEDFIELETGVRIALRKVPFYDSYLWEE